MKNVIIASALALTMTAGAASAGLPFNVPSIASIKAIPGKVSTGSTGSQAQKLI